MNLVNVSRSLLSLIPGANQAFDTICARVNLVFGVEHDNDTGTHTDITATSITVATANITSGLAVTGYVTAPLIFGSASANGTFGMELRSAVTQYSYTPPDFASQGSTAGLNINDFDVDKDFLPLTDNAFDLGFAGAPNRRWRNLWMSGFIDAPYLHGSTSVSERNRAKAMGEWTTFTPTQTATTGTWTGSTITTAQYMLVGKTIFIQFAIDAGNNSAATAELLIAIPGGFSAKKFVQIKEIEGQDLGAETTGISAYAVASGTTIHFYKALGGNWALNAANGNQVRGLIFFEIT